MRTAIAAALVLAALLIAGRSDYNEAVDQRRVYCDNVREGAWPAYAGPCEEE